MWIAPSSIRPVTRQRVIGVADRHNPGEERNLVAGEAVWVAAAVESLMVVADDRQDVRGRRERLDDAFAVDRLCAHLPFFAAIHRSGLADVCVRDRDLAAGLDEPAARS